MLVLIEVGGHLEAELDEPLPQANVGLVVRLDIFLQVVEVVQVLLGVVGVLGIIGDLSGHVADHVEVDYLLAGDDVPQQR